MRIMKTDGTVIDAMTIDSATIMQPVDIQSRYSQTIQTHNAVSVGAGSATAPTSFIDCAGFESISVTMLNDAATLSIVSITWSHDSNNTQGIEALMTNSTDRYRIARSTVKARYARLNIANNDTVAHTMSSWIYLIT